MEEYMPKIKTDRTSAYIRAAIIRGDTTVREICRSTGMKEATMNEHIRNPETLRLNEIRVINRYAKFTDEEKKLLIEGMKL